MPTKFKNFFTGLIPSQKGEYTRTILMFLLLFLIISIYSILRPVRDALFLTQVGSTKLPYLYMLLGLVGGTTAFLYGKYLRTVHIQKLMGYTLVVSILSMFALWWLNTDIKTQWVNYSTYLWLNIFGIVINSQFWLLGNRIFDAREAKRNFSFMAAGGILGGVLGSAAVTPLQNILKTPENLLLACVALLIFCLVILYILWRERASFPRQAIETQYSVAKQKVQDLWSTVRHTRLLHFIIGVILVSVIVSYLVDFQFKTIVSKAFKSKEDQTRFFAHFNFYLSLFSLALQLFFTENIVKRFGVGIASAALPSALLLSTLAFMMSPILGPAIILWGAILIKVSDKGLKYSLYKTGMELFYVPIPYEVRAKAKVFTDWFVNNIGQVLSGALLLALIMFSGRLLLVSALVLFMLSLWLLLLYKARRTYTETFKETVQKQKLRPEKMTTPISDPLLVSMLLDVLKSSNENQVLYALELLEGSPKEQIEEPARNLLTRTSPAIRTKAIDQLRASGVWRAIEKIKPLIQDQDETVRTEALSFVSTFEDQEHLQLQQFLQGNDRHKRGAAIASIKKLGGRLIKDLFTVELVQKLTSQEGEKREYDRQHAAEILGVVGKEDQFKGYFLTLLTDASPPVVRSGIKAVAEADRVDLMHLLTTLILDHRYRAEVKKALASLGDKISSELQMYLIDENQNPHIKHELVRTVGGIYSQKMVNFLLEQIPFARGTYREQMVKALNKQHSRFPDLTFNYRQVQNCLNNIARESYSFLAILCSVPGQKDTPGLQLFKVSLQERLDQNREHIFRLLGLIYPAEAIHGAFEKMKVPDPHKRADAIEYLDNQLKKDLKKFLVPLLDESQVSTRLESGKKLYGIKVGDFESIVAELSDYFDSWLLACALYTLGELKMKGFFAILERIDKSGELKERGGRLLDEIIELVRNRFQMV